MKKNNKSKTKSKLDIKFNKTYLLINKLHIKSEKIKYIILKI